MRDLTEPEVDRFRSRTPEVLKRFGSYGNAKAGVFFVAVPAADPLAEDPITLKVLAASGKGWDHVSVSARDRPPTWDEMEAVKRLFFRPNETAMQLHVPVDDHINHEPNVLHIWRPHRKRIPRPPDWMV